MNFSAFHKLTYGLYVIATEIDGKKYGYIANTAFQITANPSKIAISCHKNNHSAQKIIDSKKFSISVLKKEVDTSLIGKFGFMSGADIDKFQGVETIVAKTGAPIVVDSSVAWFDCEVLDYSDVGSHLLIIAEVVDGDKLSDEEPLTYAYYHAKYKMLSPKNAPTYIDKDKLEDEPEPVIYEEVEEEKHEHTKSADGIYSCNICGFQYDPDEGDPSMGIPPGTPFEDVPDDWKCPLCNASKDDFTKV
ncbi:flavin reductase [Draconibacterium sp. IB214405]|uniref:flavin reductase n=1 Tax=Draconibacterium sp. IB214405 TaxID=3097352 RepID=UPI002A13E313|nr:flavin reductase [Draconibacterium sp. IB214405]MDX8341198.1 flavin reductase [Draconibacterium sp. IB214405]